MLKENLQILWKIKNVSFKQRNFLMTIWFYRNSGNSGNSREIWFKFEQRNPFPYDIKFDFCNEGVLFTKKFWLAPEDYKDRYKRGEGTKEHEIQASNY